MGFNSGFKGLKPTQNITDLDGIQTSIFKRQTTTRAI